MRPANAMRALLLAALLLTGCAGQADGGLIPGPARIDVDTPELQALRKDAGVAPCEPGAATAVEGGLPDLTLPCLGGGKAVDLAGLRGPMVVSLWASWCTPCRTELPILQQFSEKYAGRVAVLGIDHNDTQPVAALELVKETGVTYPLLADPQQELSGRAPFPVLRGLPYLAFVDRDGTVVFQEYVAIRSRAQLEALVAEHLGVTA